MRSYKKLRESGIDWVPVIPSHWNVKRIGQIAKERSEVVNDTEFPPLSVTKNGILPQIEGVAKTDNNDNRKKVAAGDFVINSRSDRKGSSGYSKLDGSVSVINIVLKLQGIFPKYSDYFFKSYEFIEEYFRNGKGIVMDLWSTRYSELKMMLVPLPPIPEQQAIVSFLDDKTSQIDTLISNSQKKIELLKEKRTALINHAVTKGLDPKSKMKDSGVEWIGEIPEGWNVKKLKQLTIQISKGTTPSTIGKDTMADGTIRFLKAENIVEGKVVDTPSFFIDEETNQLLLRSQLREFDILFVIAGATIGKTAILSSEFLPANTNQAISFIRLKGGTNVSFVSYWLRGARIQEQISIEATQAAQPNLSMEDLGNFYIPYPNIDEQQEIVEYLDHHTSEIDKEVSLEEKRIELLKEYRQSLISEVVTGKINVSDYALQPN